MLYKQEWQVINTNINSDLVIIFKAKGQLMFMSYLDIVGVMLYEKYLLSASNNF